MAEWHLTPEYIVNNWSDEMLNLMIEKRNERLGPDEKPDEKDGVRYVSDEQLLKEMNIKVNKEGDSGD